MYFYDVVISLVFFFFFFNAPAPSEIYTLSLHDALPIFLLNIPGEASTVMTTLDGYPMARQGLAGVRSEEHTSELQSRFDLVCRLLLEKKKKTQHQDTLRRHRRTLTQASTRCMPRPPLIP